jgi:hypothetical protein
MLSEFRPVKRPLQHFYPVAFPPQWVKQQTRYPTTKLLRLRGRRQSWPSFRSAQDRTEGRPRSRPSLRIRAAGELKLSVTGCPVVTDGLDGNLGRLQAWLRREDGLVRVRLAGLRRSAGAASCSGSVPWRPPSCAAAVRRAAAVWCGGFPAGASRPLSAVAPAFLP